MRKIENFNSNWRFLRSDGGPEAAYVQGMTVQLPHTWNAEDGTDGGNDYYRGRCWYVKKFTPPVIAPDEQLWLQFDGAAMTAEVYLNGRLLTCHKGGYSTFRAELTEALKEGENLLAVSADNGKNDSVYPQKADFTFYGGLYRNVHLLTVPEGHFALGYYGAPGIRVTPLVTGHRAEVTVEVWTENVPDGTAVTFAVSGGNAAGGVQEQTAYVSGGHAAAVFALENVHLWDGVEDPYLYTAAASLADGDRVQTEFGCRTIAFDPEKGFLLNGRPYRLCGAARHQDRQGLGSALNSAEHEEDLSLMREMGANTVRLAHYQHDQYFYDLCDRYGMVVWAEIPYITEHLPNGQENTLSQMRELILQNYNHPSIVCWGLSNEITAAGGVTEALKENHRVLNDLCHELDKTRPTTMAHVFMLDPDDPFVMLPDIRSYNLYYGWYVGEWEQNDVFFDEFRRNHPDAVIGLSEYGADANPAYHSARPEKGDWTEDYQALYHEHMLKMWSERPYIWAMHCWNMFDFGADGRGEGGKPGQNQKGLVTFDRKTKKDAFYIYKAYLSREPFVHLCGRRYVNRTEVETEVKVYSNLSSVKLYVDGQFFGEQTGEKIFRFRVPLAGEHEMEARAGGCTDRMTIRHVEKPDASYVKAGGEVVNWFDKPEEVAREGYYSILDSMAVLKQNPQTAVLLAEIMEKAAASYGDVARNVQMPKAIQEQMDKAPLQNLLKQAGSAITPGMVKQLNAALNQIPRS